MSPNFVLVSKLQTVLTTFSDPFDHCELVFALEVKTDSVKMVTGWTSLVVLIFLLAEFSEFAILTIAVVSVYYFGA